MRVIFVATALATAFLPPASATYQDNGTTDARRKFKISLHVAEIDVASRKVDRETESAVFTLEGRSASFLSGGKEARPQPAACGQVGVQFSEFDLRATFLVKNLKDGKIEIEADLMCPAEDPHHRAKYTDRARLGKNLRREVFKDENESVVYHVEYTIEEVKASEK
jgi:hypothetical protein